MELNMVYVVSERPAVGLSGPMVDPEGLSRYPSLIPDWPCSIGGLGSGFANKTNKRKTGNEERAYIFIIQYY